MFDGIDSHMCKGVTASILTGQLACSSTTGRRITKQWCNYATNKHMVYAMTDGRRNTLHNQAGCTSQSGKWCGVRCCWHAESDSGLVGCRPHTPVH